MSCPEAGKETNVLLGQAFHRKATFARINLQNAGARNTGSATGSAGWDESLGNLGWRREFVSERQFETA
jgi:hypothetical protein